MNLSWLIGALIVLYNSQSSVQAWGSSDKSKDNLSKQIPEKKMPMLTHELKQPYIDQDFQARWWDFGGNTIVNTNKYVRLTSDRPSQSGWLFSRLPLTARQFEVEVEFAITGKSTGVSGDGMAIWFTEDRGVSGPVFGHKDLFRGLGIFIDTYKNNRPGTAFPYVMAMVGDGQTAYDIHHDGKDNEIAGCSARGLRSASVPTKIRIRYDSEHTLTVDLQYKSDSEWTLCFSAPNVILPGTYYLGFSALTGQLHDNHDIISVNTLHVWNPAPNKNGNDPRRGHRAPTAELRKQRNKAMKNRSGGWAWYLIKIFFMGAVVIVLYVLYTNYKTKQRQKRYF